MGSTNKDTKKESLRYYVKNITKKRIQLKFSYFYLIKI